MTDHTLPQPQVDQVSAFAHLARAQSRMSLKYAHWGAEALKSGRIFEAGRWASESKRLRRDAQWAIGKARDRKAFRIGREHTGEEQDV